ncbi:MULTISPECIES: sterol desaturase family protein [unclassified Mesorhizobium]|uniref:sterol desaturase family protein n=1 Tax=unclassified Mesorhizobium TaxID=325217 RepID=UPI000FCC43FF|nr:MULTISPECIES: sterol desaturase family protein [unclassified Mesorhizobium]TIS97593.1 MAG: sterol desaturase family protein [Mesorhizobium sp.]RUW53871.1 sterol desaturase family protein [Mesorhizobium sp. M8A.F.Ca.ET.021.01.1.1]TGP94046.1 sterol desaturase family protein [Mesorhizobium sp. M8A.F.Ca.ET.218.01.1.1]TGS47561.1 sterol desaturase family protein [Mesorhizobium sp. M8A.F.Ca.ET.182.01.1.1]TGS84150.1 sterol desaturase family protein [Mesorhizobium sp. M8A.F.Ca.ET.181.01.1.1]
MDIFGIKGLLICALIFIPFEHLFAERPQKILRKGLGVDLIYVLFNGLVVKAVIILIAANALEAAAMLIPRSVTLAVGGQPIWLQVAEIIVISDIGVYWAHRAFHEIPALWKFHAVHHGIEELDWLGAFHSHPVDAIVTKAISLTPIFFLGFSEASIAVFSIIYFWHTLLVHSNLRIPFGPLKWLIASPQFHRWHHANQREAYDKNFAGQLPFLDVVFGTYNATGNKVPEKYGVDDPVPSSYFGQIGYPLRRRRTRSDRAVRDGEALHENQPARNKQDRTATGAVNIGP